MKHFSLFYLKLFISSANHDQANATQRMISHARKLLHQILLYRRKHLKIGVSSFFFPNKGAN
jgi:hypothetical protein